MEGKNPWYSLDRRLSGPQGHFGHGGEEKIPSHPPPRVLSKMLHNSAVLSQIVIRVLCFVVA
jgi:hypothetical protein